MFSQQTLRHRPTGKRYAVLNGQAYEEKTNSFLDHTPQPQFSSFKRDLKKRIAELPDETQQEVLDQVEQVLATHGDQLLKLFESEETQNTLIQSLANIFLTTAEQVEQKVSVSSSTTCMSVPLFSMAAASYGLLPALVMLLNMSTPAAAATSWVIHSGKPSGGSDLCSGIIFGCLQGYLTNGNQPWTYPMPQFSRAINQATSKASTSAYQQLKDCISLDSMGEIVANGIENSPSGARQTCAVTTGIWQGYQTSFQATNVPAGACPGIMSADLALGASCQSLLGALKQLGIILGVSLGVGIPVVLLCVAGYYFKNKVQDCIANCRRGNDERPPVGIAMSTV